MNFASTNIPDSSRPSAHPGTSDRHFHRGLIGRGPVQLSLVIEDSSDLHRTLPKPKSESRYTEGVREKSLGIARSDPNRGGKVT